jgi:hypothetical protein
VRSVSLEVVRHGCFHCFGVLLPTFFAIENGDGELPHAICAAKGCQFVRQMETIRAGIAQYRPDQVRILAANAISLVGPNGPLVVGERNDSWFQPVIMSNVGPRCCEKALRTQRL